MPDHAIVELLKTIGADHVKKCGACFDAAVENQHSSDNLLFPCQRGLSREIKAQPLESSIWPESIVASRNGTDGCRICPTIVTCCMAQARQLCQNYRPRSIFVRNARQLRTREVSGVTL